MTESPLRTPRGPAFKGGLAILIALVLAAIFLDPYHSRWDEFLAREIKQDVDLKNVEAPSPSLLGEPVKGLQLSLKLEVTPDANAKYGKRVMARMAVTNNSSQTFGFATNPVGPFHLICWSHDAQRASKLKRELKAGDTSWANIQPGQKLEIAQQINSEFIPVLESSQVAGFLYFYEQSGNDPLKNSINTAWSNAVEFDQAASSAPGQ